MMSILFVDDEVNILEGIRNSLRKRLNIWHVEFAESGEEALNILAAKKIDIIVSDMRMPGMDGATLLSKVQEIYPEMTRIILTGQADRESMLRAIPVTHQFLCKPISPQDLLAILDRICALYSRIQSDKVRHLVGSIRSIPSQPKTAMRLSGFLAAGNPSLKDLGMLIEQDPGLFARIIQVANSAFCGGSREVTSISVAISILGTEFVQGLAIVNEVFATTPANRHLMPLIEATFDKAFRGGSLAVKFLKNHPESGFAMTSLLLRDIGLIITATANRSVCDLTMVGQGIEGESLVDLEFKVFGLTHAEVGGHLLALWGMPTKIVEAVTFHHTIDESTIDPLIMAAIHVSDIATSHDSMTRESLVAKLNWEFIERHQLTEKVNEWLDIALGQQMEAA